MKIFKSTIYFILAAVLIQGAAQAESAQETKEKLELSIDNIMEGPELVGTAPSTIMWSLDGKQLYFRWKKPGEKKVELFALNMSDLSSKKIDDDILLKNPPSRPSFSGYRYSGFFSLGFTIKYDRQKKRALFLKNGDISLIDIKSGKISPLVTTDDREANADFCFDQKSIYFTSSDNLFVLSLEKSNITQITSFTRKERPESTKPGEIEKWYRDQQRRLFEEFSKPRRMSQRGINPSLGNKKSRKPFFLSEDQNIYLLEPSPDNRYVLFFLSERVPEIKPTEVPNYVTRSGYTETIPAHTKSAESPRQYKAGIMKEDGNVNWIDYGQEDRLIFPSSLSWSPDGKKCLLEASSEDRKDQWLFLLDLETGKTSIIEHVHDDAWIGRLGLTNIVWWPDSRYISYISEKSGYAHLYKANLEGSDIQILTEGKFEVYSASLSRDGKKWYLSTNEKHPGERHFYIMSANGGKRTRITEMTGRNETTLSPDESNIAILYSYTNKPPELYVQKNRPGSKPARITQTTNDLFRSYPWYDPEIITFRARDGVDIYARVYKPQDWHHAKPAVIFIHGAGYLQNAHKGWSSYSREYMFHNFLMEKGYLVFDLDYRGSAGYGRDCRTGIYRHMGGKDLDDIVDGAKFLVEKYGVDPQRIGTYGGSYGGFLTLMAMFTTPDVFKAGAALRPVTDWAHYHPGYTVDILNLPQMDSEAYKQSSPINFAEGLKGFLLICHGMVDTNVHFQDTVRLVQRLIELRKENWEAAIYPVEGHAFHNSSSWVDEYKRIFKLFENNLK